MSTSVFLSHAAADAELVGKVVAHAQPLEVTAYIFEGDPQPGTNVDQKLEQRIRNADAMIVLLTTRSQHRPSVHTEIGIARALGKPIIPVIEVGVDPLQFVFLQGLEWIPLDYSRVDQALLGIQNSLKRLQDSARNRALIAAAVLLVIAALFYYASKNE